MSDDNVVDFRSRDQVPRRIERFRSDPMTLSTRLSPPMRIDGRVTLGQLLRALRSEGLTYRVDERTGYYVIMQREASDDD